MNTISLDFSLDQEVALDKIQDWRARQPRGDKLYLTLGGYAGTGKTSLIAYLADIWPNVGVAAFCGKAAHVLRSKGVKASTIHSLIYVPIELGKGRVRYVKRQCLDGVETLIIDEASMIDHLLFHDILSFRIPTLFVGDHGQLEPIGTNPKLMANPMVRLEKIHRQAEDNPIIRLAAAFREGRSAPSSRGDQHGRLRLLGRSAFDRLLSPGRQVICGFNTTRHRINAHIREMKEVSKCLVAPGDTLICLRNNKVYNIFNGQQVTVLDIVGEGRKTIDLEVEGDDGRSLTITALREQFGNNLIENFRHKEVVLLDYGYALTAHKAQGSEWDEVLVLEEISKRWDARRWRYTVATRARKRLIYCR